MSPGSRASCTLPASTASQGRDHAVATSWHACQCCGRAPVYVRHRPERTLFYQIIEEYLPELSALLSQKCIELSDFVERKFDAYLACGRLEHGFLRVRCEQCHAEQPVAFSCKRHGFCPSCGARLMAEIAALYHGIHMTSAGGDRPLLAEGRYRTARL